VALRQLFSVRLHHTPCTKMDCSEVNRSNISNRWLSMNSAEVNTNGTVEQCYFCRRRLPIHRVKRRHSNLWSRYDLHVAGHDVALCEFN